MAFSEPILLRDGQVLGPVDVKRDEIDSEKAIQALGELYPTLRALPVDSVVTKKSLERLVRELHAEAKKNGATLKGTRDYVLASLRSRGAIATTSKVSIQEREK